MEDLNNLCYLDKIRLESGIDELKNHFSSLIESNKDKAIASLNDHNLRYATLFLLRVDIENHNIIDNINPRTRIALKITNEVLSGEKSSLSDKYSLSEYLQIVHSTLIWILKTGLVDDGLNNEYDEVLDRVAILLTKVYKDKSVLPLISDAFFKRCKKGTFNHDLIWTFFETEEPTCLMLIAEHLKSKDNKENRLACKLLNFVPEIEEENNNNRETQYDNFVNWFEENRPFLCYTGESFQQTSYPFAYVVDLESKYLCRANLTEGISNPKILSAGKSPSLTEFNKLDMNTREQLSHYSYKLYRHDRDRWNRWIQSSIDTQLQLINEGQEGYYD